MARPPAAAIVHRRARHRFDARRRGRRGAGPARLQNQSAAFLGADDGLSVRGVAGGGDKTHRRRGVLEQALPRARSARRGVRSGRVVAGVRYLGEHFLSRQRRRGLDGAGARTGVDGDAVSCVRGAGGRVCRRRSEAGAARRGAWTARVARPRGDPRCLRFRRVRRRAGRNAGGVSARRRGGRRRPRRRDARAAVRRGGGDGAPRRGVGDRGDADAARGPTVQSCAPPGARAAWEDWSASACSAGPPSRLRPER